jgi:hypothetical protein
MISFQIEFYISAFLQQSSLAIVELWITTYSTLDPPQVVKLSDKFDFYLTVF